MNNNDESTMVPASPMLASPSGASRSYAQMSTFMKSGLRNLEEINKRIAELNAKAVPILQKLATGFNRIHAGLTMVEAKCIDIDDARAATSSSVLRRELWQALIALQRAETHEHQDFLIGSQHPSATHEGGTLAKKARMHTRKSRHDPHIRGLLRRRDLRKSQLDADALALVMPVTKAEDPSTALEGALEDSSMELAPQETEKRELREASYANCRGSSGFVDDVFQMLSRILGKVSPGTPYCMLAILESMPVVIAADLEDQVGHAPMRRWYFHLVALAGIALVSPAHLRAVSAAPWLPRVLGVVMLGSALWYSLITETARAGERGLWGGLLWLLSFSLFILTGLANRAIGIVHLLVVCTIAFAVLGLLRTGQGASVNAFVPLAATCSVLAVAKLNEDCGLAAERVRRAVHIWTTEGHQQ